MQSGFCLDGPKVVVTGTSGFIGGYVAKRLKGMGQPLIEVTRSGAHAWGSVDRLHFGDAELVVFHFAGATPAQCSPDECYRINRELDNQIINLARRCRTRWLVYASTVNVYGETPTDEVRTVSEADDRRITNPYSLGKSETEDALMEEEFCRILRISSPFREGSGASPGLYGTFTRTRDKMVIIDPFRLQNYVSLARLFEIALFAISHNYSIINAVGPKSVSNLELGLKIAEPGSHVLVQVPTHMKPHGFVYRSHFYAGREQETVDVRE